MVPSPESVLPLLIEINHASTVLPDSTCRGSWVGSAYITDMKAVFQFECTTVGCPEIGSFRGLNKTWDKCSLINYQRFTGNIGVDQPALEK